MILELTFKEAEMVEHALNVEREFVMNRHRETKQEVDLKATETCDSALAKVGEAFGTKPEVLLTAKDLFHIIDSAKNEYMKLRTDLHISNKKVEESDFRNISVANATIMWLNAKGLLKRLVGFDYTDSSYKYEEMGD